MMFFDKYNRAYDNLPHSERFPLFLFGIMLPLLISLNCGIHYINLPISVISMIVFAVVAMIAGIRILYIYNGNPPLLLVAAHGVLLGVFEIVMFLTARFRV